MPEARPRMTALALRSSPEPCGDPGIGASSKAENRSWQHLCAVQRERNYSVTSQLHSSPGGCVLLLHAAQVPPMDFTTSLRWRQSSEQSCSLGTECRTSSVSYKHPSRAIPLASPTNIPPEPLRCLPAMKTLSRMRMQPLGFSPVASEHPSASATTPRNLRPSDPYCLAGKQQGV